MALCLAESLRERLASDPAGLGKLEDLRQVLALLGAMCRPAGPWPQAEDRVLPSAPDPVLERSVALARALAGGTVAFEVRLGAAGAWVPVPDLHLQQILFNLLKNAVEAAPPGTGRVVVESSLLRGGGRDRVVRIVLTDNGPGIAADLRPRLFQAGATTKAGGRGLGLHHARHLAQRYGGTITLDGCPGAGARATLTWPALPAAASGAFGSESLAGLSAPPGSPAASGNPRG